MRLLTNEESGHSYVGNMDLDDMKGDLSRGVLPENLRRGPYAVVDERCEDTTLGPI